MTVPLVCLTIIAALLVIATPISVVLVARSLRIQSMQAIVAIKDMQTVTTQTEPAHVRREGQELAKRQIAVKAEDLALRRGLALDQRSPREMMDA